MSRPVRPLGAAATAARAALPPSEADTFDRLASAVLAAPGAPLGAVLRAQLPGPTGVRWLRTTGLPPTARASALTTEHWSSLYRCWQKDPSAPHRSHARGGTLQGGRPEVTKGGEDGSFLS